MDNAPRLAAVLSAVMIIGVALVVAQPSLNPPAGPVGESGRFGTLIELNEITAPGNSEHAHVISAPGSYLLTGDIDAGALNGILINAEDVTLDLNGYTLRGTGSLGVTIRSTGQSNVEIPGVTVRNGRIAGFDMGFVGFREGRNFNLQDVLNRFTSATLLDLSIRDVRVGVLLMDGIAERCQVVAEEIGFIVSGATLRTCSVRLTGDSFDEVYGIDASGALLTDCVVDALDAESSFELIGIRATDTLLRGCTVSSSEAPFALSDGSLAEACRAAGSPTSTVDASSTTFSSNF